MAEHSTEHHHIFLAPGHAHNERKTWAVIWLSGLMMMVEIVGGTCFGSVALVADGLHMSTHAAALLIAALAYTYARKHATDPRFSFGTGKLGDLAGFTSAVVLGLIALLIGYESVGRLMSPVPIDFGQAIPIAVLGLGVNVISAWLLSGGNHAGHEHGHASRYGQGQGQGHDHADADADVDVDVDVDLHLDLDLDLGDDVRSINSSLGTLRLEVFEGGGPPRFRLRAEGAASAWQQSVGHHATIETLRPDGMRQTFHFGNRGAYLESIDAIPEPHEFIARLRLPHHGGVDVHELSFIEHEHEHEHDEAVAKTHRDNNMRAALVHVIADAAVSVLVIVGLLLARRFDWLWIDPAVGVVGAVVIANWSRGLIRDTGAILLDMNADADMSAAIRSAVEANGDLLADLHVWRLGPGHLAAIVSIVSGAQRGEEFYRTRLGRYRALSHLTIEVRQQ